MLHVSTREQLLSMVESFHNHENLCPPWQVILVSRGRDIILGGGNVHCITQQQPAVA